MELLARFDPRVPVRLLGVGVAGLVSAEASPRTRSGPAQNAGPLELDLGLQRLTDYRVLRTLPVVPNPSFAFRALVRSHSRLPA